MLWFIVLHLNRGHPKFDYFTPLNRVAASAADVDFRSGRPLLLPDLTDATGTTRHLAVGSGKDANIYVLDRDNMGKFNPNQDNAYELISGELAGGEFAKPSYFNGTVYCGAVGDALKAFPITDARLAVTLLVAKLKPISVSGNDAEHFRQRRCVGG